jgi:O-antigen ligase
VEIQGYPQFVVFFVLGAGLCLAVLRPYIGFLFALFLVTAGHVTLFNQTRTVALGPYFNLTDACMLVGAVALFLDKFRKTEPIWLPQIVILMLLVMTTAAIQSLWKFDWSYESMRAFRWALQTPVAIFLGANMVTSADRAKKLVAVLLAGALLAAIQHVAFVANVWRTSSLDMRTYQAMRTIGFLAGCMPSAFLVSAILWEGPRGLRGGGLYFVAGLLLLASLFLNQTRSLWIATVAAGVIAPVLFKRRNRGRRIAMAGISLVLLLLIGAVTCRYLLPRLDVVGILADRTERLFNDKTQMGTRGRAFAIETEQWFAGSLIFGRGLCFFQTMDDHRDDFRNAIAFNHLGYITYLSQMGIVGLVVYGFFLPLGVLLDGRRLWRNAGDPAVQFTGLLGGASIICLSITFLMSSHFLALGYFAPAALYGGAWRLSNRPWVPRYA